MDKKLQLSYTGRMKRVTMRDFHWLGTPECWKKDYRELSLTVSSGTDLPEGPLLLSVSDEDFSCSMELSLAPDQGSCGLCIYHSEQSYAAVGLSVAELKVHTSVHGFATNTTLPLQNSLAKVIWHMERQGEKIRIGYSQREGETVHWVCNTSLPGIKQAVSFGPFFSNNGPVSYTATMKGFSYKKSV